MAFGERTKSTAPEATALRGMLSYFADCGASANVMPPSALIAFSPRAPSDALPERMPATARPRRQVQDTLDNGHARVWRHDVHMARLDAQAVLHLDDRYPGHSGQNVGQDARVLRVEVLDKHEGHQRIDRQVR